MTYPQNSAIELEARGLCVDDIAILFTLDLGHERGLMNVGVELLGLAVLSRLTGVESLQTVLLQSVQQNVLGHPQAGHEVHQFLVGLGHFGLELLSGNSKESPVEVVNALEQVDGEPLNGEIPGILHVTLGAFLQVEEVCNGTHVLVLCTKSAPANMGWRSSQQ